MDTEFGLPYDGTRQLELHLDFELFFLHENAQYPQKVILAAENSEFPAQEHVFTALAGDPYLSSFAR